MSLKFKGNIKPKALKGKMVPKVLDWSNLVEQKELGTGTIDFFGQSVSITPDGNTAIVGEPKNGPGYAHIFTRTGTTWTLAQTIGGVGDEFGYSVDISDDGNTVICGAYSEGFSGDVGRGAAYIYINTEGVWSLQARIQASNGDAQDKFGWAVSISGDGNTAISGAYDQDTTNASAGSIYVYNRVGTSWPQQQILQANDPANSDRNGYAVSISGDGNTFMTGAHGDDEGGSNSGAVYFFTRTPGDLTGTAWTQEQKMPGGGVGRAVSISYDGNTAVAGGASTQSYIYTRTGTTWITQQTLTTGGTSVSISSDSNNVLVGLNTTQTTFIYTRSGNIWTEQQQITPSDTTTGYGVTCAISDTGPLVTGANNDSTLVDRSGAAYFYVAA